MKSVKRAILLATFTTLILVASFVNIAFACELGPQFVMRTTGAYALLATAAVSSTPANGVRVDVIAGRSPTGVPTSGTAIFVPWTHGSDCKPQPWPATRPWPHTNTAALFLATARPRDRWIANIATFDVWMADVEPVWSDNPRGYSEAVFGRLLTPAEAFDFYWILPTADELDRKLPAAFARISAWASAHPSLATREPARGALSFLRRAWGDTTSTHTHYEPPRRKPGSNVTSTNRP